MKYPLPKTLAKYGLTKRDYRLIYKAQGGCCAICGNTLEGRRTNIDHQHGIKGWKNLHDNERKKYCRGILCWTCNHLIVGRGVTIARLKSAITYLEKYDARIREVD